MFWDIILSLGSLLLILFILIIILSLIGDVLNRYYPKLQLWLAIIFGLLSYFFWIPKIWVAILITFLSIGILGVVASFSRVKSPKGNDIKCSKCGSYWLDEISRTNESVGYKCKKCGNTCTTFFIK